MKSCRINYKGLERACPWVFTNEYHDGRGCLMPTDKEVGLSEAQAHWASVVQDQVPGLAISDYPQVFMLQIDRFLVEEGQEPGWLPVYFVETEGILEGWTKDEDFRGEVLCYSKFDETPLTNWSYSAAAENCGAAISHPDPKNLPNPRVYWLDGTLAIGWNDQKPIGPWLMHLFQEHIRCVWSDGRNINHRATLIAQFLDHHRDEGGDAEKFIDYVGDLIVAPPKGFDALLVAKLKAWCQRAGKPPARASEPPVLGDLLGASRWSKLKKAMTEEGYLDSLGNPNRLGRGKAVYPASVHAALDKFGITMPLVKHWPAMLDAAFPGLKAGEKLTPTLKPAQQTAEYKEAFANITAHLS